MSHTCRIQRLLLAARIHAMTHLRSLATAAMFALCVVAPASAQSDATIQRIWRLGMDSSHVQQLSQTLFDSIGPRLTGSPGIRSASVYDADSSCLFCRAFGRISFVDFSSSVVAGRYGQLVCHAHPQTGHAGRNRQDGHY